MVYIDRSLKSPYFTGLVNIKTISYVLQKKNL